MRHLIRPVALLASVVVIIIIARTVPTPEFLDAYGFFSGTAEENFENWADEPWQYIGSAPCSGCHQSQYELWQSADHSVVECENCHGPARNHMQDFDPLSIDPGRGLCVQCHDQLISRPELFPQVDTSVMGGDAECITCHNSHSPRVGIPEIVPHPLDGHEICTDCHASHEPWETTPTQVPHTLEGRTNCLACHGPDELRGDGLPTIPKYMVSLDCFTCHGHGEELVAGLPEDHAGRPATTCANCHRVSE